MSRVSGDTVRRRLLGCICERATGVGARKMGWSGVGGSGRGAPVVRRAVIFVMPEAHVQAVSELRFEPAPRNVQRVFWMRHEI